jgi:hypothetical protein
MDTVVDRRRFEDVAGAAAEPATVSAWAVAAKAGDQQAAVDLAAQFVRVAAMAPEDVVVTYDAAALGWLGERDLPELSIPVRPGPDTAGDDFWPAFWDLVLDPTTGRDAGDITMRTAALSGMCGPSFREHLAGVAMEYPGVAAAVAAGDPVPFTLAQLRACPSGSLGGTFHDLIVDNGFDLEVLDRDSLALADLPVPLGYLNSRILQCHDLWHLVAGFDTTILHEVAISGFQLGQFGHHYSSMFLAVTASKVALTQPLGVGLVYETVLTGWVHGRRTPPLLGVPWEQVWDRPVEAVRSQLGVEPYPRPFPADLLEQLMAG